MHHDNNISERRELRHHDIMECALTCFNRDGIQATTMTDIAAAMGVSRKTLYTYVTTKDEVVASLLDTISTTLEHQVGEIVSRGDLDVLDRLQRVFELIGSGLQRSHRFLSDVSVSHPVHWKNFEERRKERAGRYFAQLIREGVASHSIRADIPPMALMAVYTCFVTGLVNSSEHLQHADQVFHAGVRLIMDGLQPRRQGDKK